MRALICRRAGPILKEMGALSELKELYLDSNQLTGKKLSQGYRYGNVSHPRTRGIHACSTGVDRTLFNLDSPSNSLSLRMRVFKAPRFPSCGGMGPVDMRAGQRMVLLEFRRTHRLFLEHLHPRVGWINA